MSITRHSRTAPVLAAALSLLALLGTTMCTERPATSPAVPLPEVTDGSGRGQIVVCKIGPVGEYKFDWSAATSTPTKGTTTVVLTSDPNRLPCNLEEPVWDLSKGAVPVTISERPTAGLRQVEIRIVDGMTGQLLRTIPVSEARTVTLTPDAGIQYLVKFVNEPSTLCDDQSAMNPGQPLPCVYGRLGDFVWIDANNNGIQDAGEAGIAGVTVTLSGAASATTTTDANGYYHFEHLAAGSYTVTVATPTGYQPSPSLAGGDRAMDSNGSPTSSTLSLSVPEDLTLDFGFAPVCTDPNASNNGQVGECQYPPLPCPAGSFTYSYLTDGGDLLIKYDQFPAPNDNSYGVNAVGWPNGHRFSDLVGSDHAGFQLVDGSGTVRLSFNVDYLSASASAPSGYASLGVTGGDGKMLVGTADGISATSSLARNLNNINIPGLFDPATHTQLIGSVNVLVSSPPTDPAHLTYDISDPALAGWDFHDTYYVTISAAKLAAIGFDPNTWKVLPNPSQLHNSPAKPCPPSGDQLSATKYEVKDKQVKVTILNSGSTDVILTALSLTWPSAVNGKLMQVKLDGDVIYSGPAIAGGSANLTTAQLVADQNKRKINHGSSDVYTLVFEKNASPDLSLYTGTVTFGNIELKVLPK